jgi:hypothetical protein
LSSSQVSLCLLTCSMFFFFYLLQMFKLWKATNSLGLGTCTFKTPLKPLLLRQGQKLHIF